MDTLVSPVEKAEPIEVPFGVCTRVGPRNRVFVDRDMDPRRKG